MGEVGEKADVIGDRDAWRASPSCVLTKAHIDGARGIAWLKPCRAHVHNPPVDDLRLAIDLIKLGD